MRFRFRLGRSGRVEPLLYLSYGMQKAGSTLAFELTRAIYESNGVSQAQLPAALSQAASDVNYASRDALHDLEAIAAEARRRRGTIVLKTHVRPTDAVAAMLADGRAIGHAVCRDPRELVLSMIDAGAAARAKGATAFAHHETIDAALEKLRRNVRVFEAWAALPGVAPLHYDDVAFETRLTVLRLCDQIGLPADPAAIERRVKSERFTQFNKGLFQRWRAELASADADAIAAEFAAFIERYGDERRLRAWEAFPMYQDGRFGAAT